MKILLYAVLGLVMVNSMDECETSKEDHNDYKLGDTIELELNKIAEIESEKLTLLFVSNQESRCPVEVNCIRAGEAKAEFKLISNKKDKASVTVEAKGSCMEEDGSCGTSATANGYTIKLLAISPYPGTEQAKQKDPVTAKLVVSK